MTINTSNDCNEINDLKSGSEEAFKALYDRYYIPLNRFAFHMVMCDESCDITQDVFAKLWERKEFLPNDVNIKSYLYKSVKNSCLNYLKHLDIHDNNKHKITESLLFADNDWDEDDEEIVTLLKKSIENLPLHQKAVIKLRCEGYSYKEIADKFNISTKTVDSHIARAYISIRRSLLVIKIIIKIILGL